MKCPWASDEIDRRIDAVIARVKRGQYQTVLDATCNHAKAFKARGKSEVLLRCLDRLAQADGKFDPSERCIYEQFKKALE